MSFFQSVALMIEILFTNSSAAVYKMDGCQCAGLLKISRHFFFADLSMGQNIFSLKPS